MANKRRPSRTSIQAQSGFSSGMVTDANELALPQTAWTYARNAINNSHKGDLGKLSNEPSNVKCTIAPFVVIGAIHLSQTRWAIFSTNNYDSEIGEFDESDCSYTKLVRDRCLNFKTRYLIKGVAKSTFDCSRVIYFADGFNLDRALNIGNIPWVQECTDDN